MNLLIKRQFLHSLAVPFFVFFMVLVPWSHLFKEIYGYGFVDREVYKNYFFYRESIFNYASFNNFFSYVTNEYLWHFSVKYLIENLGVEIDYIFNLISILCLSVFGVVVFRLCGIFALLLLVNPLVVDLAFSQLRLALAISLLGLSYLLNPSRKLVIMILILLSLLIHTASIVFIFIFFSIKISNFLICRLRRGPFFHAFCLCLIGVFVSIALGPMRESILSLVSDRRVDYIDMSSSFAYSSIWVFLLFAIFVKIKVLIGYDYVKYSVVIMSIVTMNLFYGGYSTRLIAATFPFLVSTILSFRREYGMIVIVFFVSYTILQWLYWLRIV